MRKAGFYSPGDRNLILCGLCNHRCRIRPGRRGICGVRENRGGRLYSLVYGRLIAENIDPIEKKPLFHFLPGSQSWSISTVGCNFSCRHCQNHEISQYPHGGVIPGREQSPESVVAAAKRSCAASISYTYVEPTIFGEFVLDCALLARKSGLKNVFVSNGYMTPEFTRVLAPLVDAVNIDIKAFTENFYHEICAARLQPVLDTVFLMRSLGVFVEITTLLIPGLNDTDDELRDIAQFIVSVDSAIPWHVTAFHPTYKMTERSPTPLASLERAYQIGIDAGLRFVYQGNVPGQDGENTLCPGCGQTLIQRYAFHVREISILDGRCPACGEGIEGVW